MRHSIRAIWMAVAVSVALCGASCSGGKTMGVYEAVFVCSEQDRPSYALSSKEQQEFLAVLNKSKRRKAWINDVPEMVLQGQKKDGKGVDEFSVFLSRGLVYRGFHLDASSERMHNRKSNCLKLNDSATSFFLQLLHNQRTQLE